jgi:membrane fusion protein (multidrug efflux system)
MNAAPTAPAPKADPAVTPPNAVAANPPGQPPSRRRALRLAAIFVAALVILFAGIPWVWHSLHTVSTDDAYVNSSVTFVAPRVEGQVSEVLVDDNNRVRKGELLVQLDPEPYQVQVAIKQAAVVAARASLVLAQATVKSQLGQARSQRFKLIRAIEDVDNQVALLKSRAATWEQSKASLVLAQQEFARAQHLLTTKVISQEEFDEKRETLDAAQAAVNQTLEDVLQTRVALGLPSDPGAGKSLTDAPADLDQTFSSVRVALAELIQSGAQLGIELSSYDLTPKQLLTEFYKRDPEGNIDRIYAEIIKDAPTLKAAQAALLQAQRDLDQAQLNLRYCNVTSEIDGVVTRRNVNPGNHLAAGQSIMAVRSLKDIWVDSNFKETQLRDLRIGQHVDLEVDMYGGRRHFEGRISGFTMGTGSTLALLPAQNATGNFVKVVQRLPVRIDVLNYDPDTRPLFVGLSVEPSVDLNSAPDGPNAGKYLQVFTDPNSTAAR